MSTTLTLAFMVKAPRPGFVKTRLAHGIGSDRACQLYRWLVERQVAAFPVGWPVTVHVEPKGEVEAMRSWLGQGFNYRPQDQGDLGARMRAAATAALETNHCGVILVGADCPSLAQEDLIAAADKLTAGADAVFGPTRDGGYYLLALKRVQAELFTEIPWSSPQTLEQSLQRSRSLGLRAVTLEEKDDIDDEDDLRRAVAAGQVPRHFLEENVGDRSAR